MSRRILLLVLIMAAPVLTAIGTQQLASTTEAPSLPTDPVTIATSTEAPPPSPGAPTLPGGEAPVVPGTAQVEADDDDDDDDDASAGDLRRERPEDVDDAPAQPESDLDGDQDDAPQSGSMDR